MKNKKIFSFSTRSINDQILVTEIKGRCNRTGESFSTYIIEALKLKAEHDKRRTKNQD